MTGIVKKCERKMEGDQDGREELSVRCVGKDRKWIVQILLVLLCILLLTEPCSDSYIIDRVHVEMKTGKHQRGLH
jgi:hypothetical protein